MELLISIVLGWFERLPARQKPKAKKKSGFSRKIVAFLVVAVFVVVVVVSYQMGGTGSPATSTGSSKVLLVTSMGNITIELYEDMPITSGNFENLVQKGTYDGTIFHRVVHDFVVQGGDASGKGITVPTIADELPNKHSNLRGSVAMAKTSEPNSATSQFYINLKDNLDLDSNYSVFGRVLAGMNVVDAIGNVSTDANYRPLQNVTVTRAELVK